MFNIDIGFIILWFVAFLFSLTIHECAHAWTSERFGDDTGRYEGRISLNPAVHIDPIGTILFPLMSLLTNGHFAIPGWAKPVNVNPNRWGDKVVANIMVSGAGPASNFLLALICGIIMKLLMVTGLLGTLQQTGVMEPAFAFLNIMIMLNISLGVFNLIPIPPLDGSHILSSILSLFSPNLMESYESLRPYGGMFLLVGCMTGVLGYIARPFFKAVAFGLWYVLGFNG